MKNALLLFLSASHLHAQLMLHGKIVAQHEFDDSAEGTGEFAAFVRSIRHPAYLLVDLIEEDFRQETVPHLGGASRNALLQRKFEQFYRGTPFRQASLLQRQKTGRRDDDMLFSALTNPTLITPWLNILLTHRIPLAGIYSVPQISGPLIKDHPSDYLLLISWEKNAGLRQTYFSNHRLQISRLTPVSAEQTFQDAVQRELPRTYQYLKSLSLLPSGQTLDVRLLGHARDLNELRALLPTNGDMHYDYIDLEKLAQQRGISHLFADSDATQIFLHQLASSPPASQYASAEHMHYHMLWHMRRIMNWGSAALLCGSLAWGIAGIWESGNNANEAIAMNADAQRILEQTHQITSTFPASKISASDMKAAVSIVHELDRQTLPPEQNMRLISHVLDRYPRVELDELAWQSNAIESSPGNTPAASPAHIVTLKGHLLDFEHDYRAALGYLERFEHDLEKQGYQVTVLTKPLDISPKGSITDQRDGPLDTLEFSLKLSGRPPV